MAEITVDLIKKLRETTGSGMMDCKKALNECNGDMEAAITWLRKKGIASADKKAGRIAAEGVVEAYIHGNGRVGVLVEVNVETDFAAKNDIFKGFARDVAMQIAAMKPRWVRREDVPEEVLNNEREIARTQALNEGKPEKIVDKIVEGRLEKFYADACLMDQNFIKDDSKNMTTVMKEVIATIGENISVRRFTRYEMGEGLEKKADDFAEEVMKQLH